MDGRHGFPDERLEESGTTTSTIYPTVDSCLHDLMEREYFLEKTLQYLVEDGLHACRRVCRQWNDICGRLPVELHWVPLDKLPELTKAFPNAASLSIDIDEADDCGTEVLSHLQSFRNLKHLEMERSTPWQSNAPLSPYFESFCHLQSLSLVAFQLDMTEWIAPALRHLKNLTSLELEICDGAVVSELAPFTELLKIQELSITRNTLENHEGMLMFPSLTHLTKLSIAEQKEGLYGSNLELLKALIPYTTSVQHLTVYGAEQFGRTDWAPLKCFTALKSLCLPDSCHQRTNLFDVLKAVTGLTELDLCLVDARPSAEMDAVYSLTGLQSLSLSALASASAEDVACTSLSQLTQLTSLKIEHIHAGASLQNLTRLVHLDIVLSETTDIDVPKTLTSLSLLKELSLDVISASDSFIQALSQLKMLNSLDLRLSSSSDEGLLPALATLPVLTYLSFGCADAKPQGVELTELNLLSNLRHLAIDFRTVESPCDYLLGGSLQSLSRLFFRDQELSDEEEQELRNRFPCLDSIKSYIQA